MLLRVQIKNPSELYIYTPMNSDNRRAQHLENLCHSEWIQSSENYSADNMNG